MRPRRLASWTACLLLAAGPAKTQTFEAFSNGLPLTNRWDCNPGAFERCNTLADTGGWVGVAFGDLDGDGLDDLVATGRLLQGYHAWLSDGAGNWTEWSTGFDPAECHGRSDAELADVDGDGRLDLGTIAGINGSPAVWRNEPSGWSELGAGLSSRSGEGFTFGDWNGDGFVDLAVSGHLGGDFRAFLGDGGSGWTEVSAGLPQGAGGHHLAAGDFDGDGRDEIVDTLGHPAPSEVLQGVHLWRLSAGGTWELLFERYHDQPHGVAVEDFDRDGRMDLAIATAQDDFGTSGSVHVLLNEGGGSAFRDWSAGLPVLAGFFGGIAAGDLDGDDDPDLVTGFSRGPLQVFLNQGDGSWLEEANTGLPDDLDALEDVEVGDADGDCRLDVVQAAYTCGVQVWRRAEPSPCPVLVEAGPPTAACAGEEIVLDASATVHCGCDSPADARFRWWREGALLRDWDASPIAIDPAGGDALYEVDAACATDLDCFHSDVVRARALPPPVPVVEPASAEVCAGEEIVLDGAGPWSGWSWSSEPPGAPGDGATDPTITVAPDGDTAWTLTVVDENGCSGSTEAAVTVRTDPLPGPVGASLRVAKDGSEGLEFRWDDPPGELGGLEVLGHPASAGPPVPATIDGAEAVAAAAPGTGLASDPEGLQDPETLVFFAVRALSPCTLTPGPSR